MSESPTPATTETTTPDEPGTRLVHLDPATLVIETNVRATVRLDEGLVASIAARGVLTPVVAHRREDGTVAVIYGQRRTLGAVQAGRESIPVHLVASPAESDRLVDQMAENDHRAALTTGERVAGFAQLAVLGLSAAQIAKRTATKSAHVKAALTAAASEVAVQAAAACQALTLDQAAVLAEFETDPEVVQALLAAVESGGFDHRAQRARDARALAEQGEKVAADLREAGVEVIEAPTHDQAPRRVNYLYDNGVSVTLAEHATCPGHAAYVEADHEWIDGQASTSDPDAYVPRVRVEVMRAFYVCREPATYGHTSYAGPAPAKVKAADMDPAQRAAEAAARQVVINSNRAWKSAATVRRQWLVTFTKRKSAPKDAPRFIAATLAAHAHTLARTGSNRHALACDLLGITAPPGWAPLVVLDERTSAPRAQVIALVLILAAYEEAIGEKDWRTLSASTADYLEWIATQGYHLAEVEHRACGHDTQPNEVDEQVDPDRPTD